jgi:hypothetical protein
MWLGLLVAGHWLLDLIVHRPDLPLIPGNEDVKLGLGLWNSLIGTLVIELGLFAAGIYLYLKTTSPKNKTGIYAFWGLIIFLTVIYINNLFGPPPPETTAIGYVGLAQWLLVLWAYWIDKNRELNES